MRPGSLPAVLSLVAVLSVAAACGGDDRPASTPSATSSPSVVVTGPGSDPVENLGTGQEFIQALVANTSESLARARALTAPRSSAARFVAQLQDELDADDSPWSLSEPGPGRYRLCNGTDCTALSGLVLLDGKVVAFKVDGKQLR